MEKGLTTEHACVDMLLAGVNERIPSLMIEASVVD
jgi:hypothetical protein